MKLIIELDLDKLAQPRGTSSVDQVEAAGVLRRLADDIAVNGAPCGETVLTTGADHWIGRMVARSSFTEARNVARSM